jgi:hypothetical protein
MMLAGGSPQAYAEATSQNGIASSPANASAQLRWNTNGDCEGAPTSGIFATKHTWRTDLTRPVGDYEIELTNTSGTFSVAAAGSGVYIALSSTRVWSRARTSDLNGTDTVSGTYSIRHIASGLVVASSTFSISAQVIV